MTSRGPVAVFAATMVVLAAYLFPYFYLPTVWWRAIPSASVILLTGALFFGHQMPRVFGLAMSWKDFAISAVLCAILLAVFSYVIATWIVVAPLSAKPHDYSLFYVHQFFQVFNDEIVLRAVLLTLLLRMIPSRAVAVFLPAAVLALAHHVVYRPNGADIGWPAMGSIFAFNAVANALFVRFRHIGYGFAAHYAWNIYRFNQAYYLAGVPLEEGQTFNYIEGNAFIVVGSLVALVLVWTGTATRSRRSTR